MSDLVRRADVLALLPDTDTVGPKPRALREKVERLPGVVRCRDCAHHAVYAETGKHFCRRPLGGADVYVCGSGWLLPQREEV